MSEYIKHTPYLHERRSHETSIFVIWCPGCNEPHGFPVRKDKGIHPNWEFNGDHQQPTFTPSLLHPNKPRCHLFLRDGVIEFCGDCDHDLAGKTVPMVSIDEARKG